MVMMQDKATSSITLPELSQVEDLDVLLSEPSFMERAQSCLTDNGKIQYPRRGKPGPYSIKICKHKARKCAHGDKCTVCVCGVGGHTYKSHASIALRVKTVPQAFRHGSWIIDHLDTLLPDEVAKQCEVLVILMCALRVKLRNHSATGYGTDPKYLVAVHLFYKSVLKMVVEKHPSIQLGDKINIPDGNVKREYRYTTKLVNQLVDFLAVPLGELPDEAYVNVEDRTEYLFRVTLFPESLSLQELVKWCDKIFRHKRFPSKEKLQTLCDTSLKDAFQACARCGLVGHNNRGGSKCSSMSDALRVVICLASLCDPYKEHRISPSSMVTVLYKTFYLIIQMLHRFWSKGHRWRIRIEGDRRMKKIEMDHEQFLMRMFNHAVLHVKMNHAEGEKIVAIYPTIPDEMVCVLNEKQVSEQKIDTKKRKLSCISSMTNEASTAAADMEIPLSPVPETGANTLLADVHAAYPSLKALLNVRVSNLRWQDDVTL